mmetsp:Transcript_8371/g.12638  ORF Transcript_8371/g.12638 Transcript_8371/m.12638 type:complete len:86 (-) Transcript_8371:740-997(-)
MRKDHIVPDRTSSIVSIKNLSGDNHGREGQEAKKETERHKRTINDALQSQERAAHTQKTEDKTDTIKRGLIEVAVTIQGNNNNGK